MPVPSLAARLRAGETCLTAWIGMPEPLVAEAAARAGFDCVTLDMQHGLQDTASVVRGIGAVALANVPAAVRIPVGDFAMASRVADMGAAAIVAPMINSVADARLFAAAVKYPPLGERSWGPGRAMALHGHSDGSAYFAAANAEVLAFAMVETRAALAIVDDILAVDGIDGIFVGPSDLSIAIGGGAPNPMGAENQAAIADILARCHKAGKFAAVFAITGAQGQHYRKLGFDLIALGTDGFYLRDGATAMLSAARADV